MKRFDIMLLGLGLVAVVATPVSAGCRSVHRCATPVVVNKVAVVEAVAAYPVASAFIPTAVVAYGAAYVGQPYQQQFAPPAGYGQAGVQGYGQQQGQQDSLLSALQRLEQRLGAIEQRSGLAPPQGQAPPMPGADQQQAPPPVQEQQTQAPPPAQAQQGQGGAEALKLFTSRCASCHSKGKEGSGGGFVLLNGSQLAPLTAEQQKKVLNRVYSTDTKIAMPRGGKGLTDEELGVVVNWLATN